MKTDPLDNLLREWASRQQPDADTLNRLEQSTTAQIREPAAAPATDPMKATVWFRPVLGRFAYAALGMAAALVALVGLHLGSTIPPHRYEEAGSGLQQATQEMFFHPAQLASARELFAQIDGTFSNGLAWLAETDQDVALGIEERPGAPGATHSPLILVRTVVLEKQPGWSSWKPIWRARVITRPEEMVRLASATSAEKMLLWTHAVNGDSIAVDSSIQLDGARGITSSNTVILQVGKPVRIQTIRADGSEYRVMQVAVLLPPEKGGKSS